MTDEKRVKAVQAALDAYRVEMKKNPHGARERLLKTGIWTKAGKLKPEYGGEPKKARTAA